MIRPTDIAILLHLRLHPDDSYGTMAERLGVSKSTAHGGVVRLLRNRLAHASSRAMAIVADDAAVDFLSYGVPYAFAPDTVAVARGVVTGLAAVPMLAGLVSFTTSGLVWPSKLGDAQGVGIAPLIPAAPDMPHRDPHLYQLLAIVDALRVGDARERELARNALRTHFTAPLR